MSCRKKGEREETKGGGGGEGLGGKEESRQARGEIHRRNEGDR